MKADDFFIMLMPSRQGKMFINTAFILANIADELGKLPMVATSDAPTFQSSRTNCLEKIKKLMDDNEIEHGEIIRALWIDDDMLIDDSLKRVVDAIKMADQLDANIVANYKLVWKEGKIVNAVGIADKKGNPYFATDEQLKNLKNFTNFRKDRILALGFITGIAISRTNFIMRISRKMLTGIKITTSG